ncbi:MAG: DUF362 domain-containing protein [Desulfatiglandaceae bacterium]|jgi:uncharacterized protein (DUF362 family)
MWLQDSIDRREAVKKIFGLAGSLALGTAFAGPLGFSRSAKAGLKPSGFLVEGTGIHEGYSIRNLVEQVFEAAGGMGRFVSRGDVVAIKPNISWARPPQLAATTNPEVLKAVIELCQEAGAKKVRIADHTIHDARRCFALTGVGAVARQTGADLVFPRSSLMREMKLRGSRLDVWPVFSPLVEADKLINLPVAKHHSLSGLTLGMKNWIGGVGGSRWSLHQDINRSIVDLAHFFKPTMTLIDAIRIMTRNGPSGGSEKYVARKNVLILSDDPVAADGKAALLFGKRPEDLGFLNIGRKGGLGTYDFKELEQKKVSV